MEKSLMYPDCDFAIWFRSVSENNITVEPIEGKKIGVIPDWIDGCLYQNGPGLLDVGENRVQHLFDAFALIQKFTIKNGHVTYQNRILQSNAYQQARQTGQRCFSEYATSNSNKNSNPSVNETLSQSTLSWLYSRIRNLIDYKNDFRTDNALISIYPYRIQNDRIALFAMTETPVMHEIDSETIETCEKFNTSEHLSIVSHCAHPVILNGGAILNVGLAPGLTGMNYVLFEFPGFSNSNPEDNPMHQCKILTKIPTRWPFNPSYMHTFAVTDNYIILIEQSLCTSVAQIIQLTVTHGPMTDALVWYGDEPVRFRLINRHTMTEHDEYTYFSAAFFFLHMINAYEDTNHLVIDVCCYENADMLKCMTIEALENAQENAEYLKQFRSRPKRFVLPLVITIGNENLNDLHYTTCRVKCIGKRQLWIEPELIIDEGCELPQIEYFKSYGKFYRFFYAINSDVDYQYCGALRKVDILAKTCQIWYEDGCYTSEPIFVRNPSDETGDEDEGVLIFSLLRSSREEEVSLVVLDAKHMIEIGRVQFEANGPVPKCLHGLWIDSRAT